MVDMDNPSKLVWHVSCDESGTDGRRFYGFGSLWMKYQRRSDLVQMIRELREKHNCTDELKRQKARSKQNAAFYNDVIEASSKYQWLAFHCITIQRAHVNREFHDDNYDLAMHKHFTELLAKEIIRVIRKFPHRECEFRIDVDPIVSRCDKTDGAFHKTANNIIKNATGKEKAIRTVIIKDSKESAQIRIYNFLLDAVMSAYQDKTSSPRKIVVTNKITSYLDWDGFHYDTWDTEQKFSIWHFYDPTKGPRELQTRKITLKYPLPK